MTGCVLAHVGHVTGCVLAHVGHVTGCVLARSCWSCDWLCVGSCWSCDCCWLASAASDRTASRGTFLAPRVSAGKSQSERQLKPTKS